MDEFDFLKKVIADKVSHMTVHDKICQIIMPAFRTYRDADGNVHEVTEVYPEMERVLKAHPF